MTKKSSVLKAQKENADILTYATKEEENEFLGISDNEEESQDGQTLLPRKRAMEVCMSDDDGNDEESEEDDLTEEEDDDVNSEVAEEDYEVEKPDRKSSRELSKQYHEQNLRTVFVGNITPKITKKVLIQLFNSEKAAGPGAVDSVRIRGAIAQEDSQHRNAKRRAIINHNFKDVNQVLCAYVVLKKKEDVQKCLSLNNHVVDGKHIRVDVIKGKKMNYDSANCVFVGNMPYNCTEEEVREAFNKCGDVTNVRLVRNKADGSVKGFGYIEFSEPMAVDFAVKMTLKMEIGGRQLRIQKWSTNETQQQKRKTPIDDTTKKVPHKKRKVILPTNMHSLEVSEYIKSKQNKFSKKSQKKKTYIQSKKISKQEKKNKSKK